MVGVLFRRCLLLPVAVIVVVKVEIIMVLLPNHHRSHVSWVFWVFWVVAWYQRTVEAYSKYLYCTRVPTYCTYHRSVLLYVLGTWYPPYNDASMTSNLQSVIDRIVQYRYVPVWRLEVWKERK